ncbi:hypothetical protein AB7M31_003020 [Pseudomonas sp. IAP-CY TE4608]
MILFLIDHWDVLQGRGEMGPDVDEGSFKKTRSFLLVFSGLLVAVWYFDAKMESISLLGNAVRFGDNVAHLWVVWTIILLYLFGRYVQHLPENWRVLDGKMCEFYANDLIRLTYRSNREQVLVKCREKFEASEYASVPERYAPVSEGATVGKVTDFQLFKAIDVSYVRFGYSFRCGMINSPIDDFIDFRVSTWVKRRARLSALIKGGLLTPFFTEYIFPICFAFLALLVTLWSPLFVSVWASISDFFAALV